MLKRAAVCLLFAAGSPVAAQPRPALPSQDVEAARVGARVITVGDVDREWQRADPAGYMSFAQQLYEIRRHMLDRMAGEELLAQEARKLGISVEKLLEQELPKHKTQVTEPEIVSLYQSLGDKGKGATLEQMRPALRAWLEQRAPESSRRAYLSVLVKTSTSARVLLDPPRFPFERASSDPVLGPETALVELMLFGDAKSAGDAHLFRLSSQARETFGDQVRVVYKAFPDLEDADSVGAALALHCAHSQQQFWRYHDALLPHREMLDPASLKQRATDASLDRPRFDTCLESSGPRAAIEESVNAATRSGVRSRPSLFVNGRLVPERPPFNLLKEWIEEELLRRARQAAAPARR